MHVAILVKEFPPNVIGGTETQTHRMARELEDRGHEVTLYTKEYPGDEPHDDPEFDLVRVPNWHLTPFASTLTFVLTVFLYLLRDSRDIDVLQCMMIYPCGFVGYVFNKLTGVPYFAWIRGGDYYFMKNTPVKRWTIARVLSDTLVLTQTEAIKQDVQSEFDCRQIEVLGNGVDIPDETAGGDAIVYVGRLKEQKGVDVLLRALDGTDENLLVVGDGPERPRLESLAADVDVDVEFTGWVDPDAVEEYYRRGKVFVLPSVRGEGLPNAVLEALSMGLPVVATNTGGIRNAIVDGHTGYVVEPGEESALRDRITLICRDDELRTGLSENARSYVVEQYAWPVIIDRLTAIYKKKS
jgi:glycosyltransferase involved in cell wall biosynthesis